MIHHVWFARRLGLAGLLGLLVACGSGPAATPILPTAAVTVIGGSGTSGPGTLPPPGITTIPAATATPGLAAAPTLPPASGPDQYPAGVNPLTGLPVDPAKLERIPVAVKITNFPVTARPQWGLSLADVVFEHLAEAGLTRFTAIFLGNDAAKVGAIRSARFIDAEIAPAFQAALVTSGSSLGTMDKLRNSAWFQGSLWRLVSEETAYHCPPLCRETPNDINTLFASTEAVRQVLATKTTQGLGRADLKGFIFNDALPAAGQPVLELALRFSAAAQVAWRYSPDSGRYLRWQEKEPGGDLITHLDALTNTPITAANVVVLQVNHVNNVVPEDFHDGGNCGVEIQLWTTGPARLFRDGQMFTGRWVRDASTDMRLRLVDDAGQGLALKPGNTWFDVVTLNTNQALNGTLYSVNNKVPDTRTGCPLPPTETPTPGGPDGTPTP